MAKILIPKVTGNITITAVAKQIICTVGFLDAAGAKFTADAHDDNLSSITVRSGDAYTCKLTSIIGFVIKSVVVTMDDEEIIKESGLETIEFDINIPEVTGDVKITVTTDQHSYGVTYNLDKVTSSNVTPAVDAGDTYETTLIADEHYEIESVTVTMGGTDITENVYTED